MSDDSLNSGLNDNSVPHDNSVPPINGKYEYLVQEPVGIYNNARYFYKFSFTKSKFI